MHAEKVVPSLEVAKRNLTVYVRGEGHLPRTDKWMRAGLPYKLYVAILFTPTGNTDEILSAVGNGTDHKQPWALQEGGSTSPRRGNYSSNNTVKSQSPVLAASTVLAAPAVSYLFQGNKPKLAFAWPGFYTSLQESSARSSAKWAGERRPA